ncbi:chloride channel protein [Jiella mangrovi]|uniref:Chloride channel protein n=1 Tax=Jiella mangrovi TaxID=2821407 RepID=A0ABS4BEB2_9HYPH|nr:chloride channel protein [Jiella mangrovi]MBP0614404.1 chloride channel protein [Jiella mangrovi]
MLAHKVSLQQRLSILIRRSEVWLVLAAFCVGSVSGLGVVAISTSAHGIQMLLFAIGPQERLSAIGEMTWGLSLLAPFAGGLALLGLAVWTKRQGRAPLDPVESNALHGGKMSMRDSLLIVAQTIASNGAGASVGLEAAYTQLGGAFGSKLGKYVHARRGDMRLLVGCGAAGAIAAAFGTPLAGAFYAFELIIGTYTIASLAPVMAAAIAAVGVTSLIGGHTVMVHVPLDHAVTSSEFVSLMVLAIVTAGCGILVMVLVSAIERAYSRLGVAQLYRPLIGGLLLIPIVMEVPQALSAGHGAMGLVLQQAPIQMGVLALMIGGKALAAAVSLGSGFRGGLFFASLLLGTLIGQLFFLVGDAFFPHTLGDPTLAATVGMAGMAAAIVGGPLTMGFLAFELYGSLPVATVVLAAAGLASLVVRATFGYSFTTWRFHLRGETIRSAHDVGLVRNLTVGRLMRRDVKTVRDDAGLKEFCRSFPLGSSKSVIAVDDFGNYAGMVSVSDAFAAFAADPDARLDAVLAQRDVWLQPQMSARQASRAFERNVCDTLAVVSDAAKPNLLGMLSESHLLRRYAEEVDKVRVDMMGPQRGRSTETPRRARPAA